jgi:hypothetical protein
VPLRTFYNKARRGGSGVRHALCLMYDLYKSVIYYKLLVVKLYMLTYIQF